MRRVDKRGHEILRTGGEWWLIKINYKIINKFIKQSHRNMLNLAGVVCAITDVVLLLLLLMLILL